jgi:DNA repair photolyase
MHEDFGSRIRVKMNAPELLEKYLQKKGFLPINREKTGTLIDYMPDKKERLARSQEKKFTIGISGGVCDIYQSADEEVEMSRRMLQVVYDFGFPVFLLTKNKLVLRDLDLLKKINDDAGATVCMTVVFSIENERLREIFEPRASTIAERFETLKTLNDGGVNTGIWMLPILPWLGDADDNLESMVKSAAGAGVRDILPGGMTLKPGRQKEGFMNVIKQHFPELSDKYARLYGNDHKYGHVDAAEAKANNINRWYPKLKRLCRKYGVRLDSW